MKSTEMFARCLLAGAVTVMAGCAGSPSNDTVGGVPGGGNAPLIYVSSARPASAVEQCIVDRVPQARVTDRSDSTTLLVGPSSPDSDWMVTLAPIGATGTTIGVYRPRSGSGDPEEPELRFHIARCAI
ncbi:hypothetical protein Bsp3421_006193 [Burkholderia sp. FERM BP-3421]|jgi:hypothetical protein|uniref:hypothetical protein n=1 Tax=Burkholderia sp. FERM BP-3421 TaxID=1494466 RepID=UPI0023618CD9|nr:hypothetical protein [Burkholderia sp. FERM BP-3421]WDD96009.1 hypothetical protein Bsp3421_006193 [Burkholderia sp. FERM BP-3421]